MGNPLYGQNKYDNSRDDTVDINESLSISPGNQGFGIYEAVYELKFGALTGGNTSITATDNGLIKTIATIPANAFILNAFMMTSELFDSDDEKGVDLAVCSTSPAAADTAMTATDLVITAMELKSSSSGALNTYVEAAFSGTSAMSVGTAGAGTHLCLINTDGSNAVDAIQTGKVIVYIKYAGAGPPVANTDV